MAQVLKGAALSYHHTANNLQCEDPTNDVDFMMYNFHGRGNEGATLGHQTTFLLTCKDDYQPKGDFRRGEITCWAGEW
eukprot:CAMPEP_0184479512 /NCGR_PEP_ID=MMETSP0113_2-20130426/1213_1 /TAXON_ID=91329 /ORGANISM="Norrisiella sphaerica, Strain BC52" /LENGTH=77 /DNA_ID=CAMNT_0026857615 /DNA_START=273 /DNA_END=503 /DNA_ORIENTATION=+